MPETPINKKREPIFAKDKIGFSNQLLLSPPTRDRELPKNCYQLQFGGLVPFTSN